MMREHDRLLNLGKEEPSEPPLAYLLTAVKGKGDRQRQRTLDRDLGLLEDLVRSEAAKIEWGDLDKIRQYTINFNPAIEFEWIADSEEDAAKLASE